MLTNRLQLPDPIVRAVENDDYSRGDAHISVTGVIGPPRLGTLMEAHRAELVEDAADRIWSLVGKIGHLILERANVGGVAERRLTTEVRGWRVSGATDHVAVEEGVLSDWKFITVWSVKDGAKPEYIAQANLYRLLWDEYGVPIKRLQIVAILRDWRKNEARRYVSSGYPPDQVAVLPVPMWTLAETREYLDARVQLHQAARALYAAKAPLPHCSPEDRWKKDTTWAVMKKGRKSAVKVCATEIEARHVKGEAPDAEVWIERRPGLAVRCAQYCAVRAHCVALADGQHEPGDLGDNADEAAA